ncbi:MAG: hypothetical protein JST16_19230 [Bdellovibrionales bacterium]|nr:hypothetical protein [Bdellovibrionales bacterium]
MDTAFSAAPSDEQLTEPPVLDFESCRRTSWPISTAAQFPPKPKDQGKWKTCYSHSFISLLESFAYRKSGEHLEFSAEAAACQYLNTLKPSEIGQRASHVELYGDEAHLVDRGIPENLFKEFVREPWPITYEDTNLKSKLRTQFELLDKQAKQGGVNSVNLICQTLKSGKQICESGKTRTLDPNFFADMQIEEFSLAAGERMFLTTKKIFSAYRSRNQSDFERAMADCMGASKELRQSIRDHLCAGLPMLATLNKIGGIEIASIESQKYTRFPGDFTIHAVVLTGMQTDQDTGHQYFIFQNSEGQAHAKIRLPVEEACQIGSPLWVTSSPDRQRKIRMTILPDHQPENQSVH